MERTFKTRKYGSVIVRNVMLENNDNTTLSEGIEIKSDDFELIEIYKHIDIEELSAKDVVELINENYS